MVNEKQVLLKQLPAVDTVLREAAVLRLQERYGQATVTRALRALLDTWRQQILQGIWSANSLQEALATLPQALAMQVQAEEQPNLHPVINATGVIIHTNLGRSLLAAAASRQIAQVAGCYSTLEVDVATGSRGSRYAHVTELLCELTGAEDALVVNNNAGAVLLTLAALTGGSEVVVSRGQLVEIGGSFRIPEVMEQSGCRLVEVGTTNKTHLFDYERAIGPDTAALLKVHTSNYRLIGFTAEVAGAELASLAHQHDLLAIEDLGSGVLIDLRRHELMHEPTVQESLAAGMDVVTFSGDKLLGGPQAGIIVGRRDCIARLRLHPLTRALRIDKLTLAGLEATLRLYLDEETAVREIPTLRMLTIPAEELEVRARALAAELVPQIGGSADINVVASLAQVGGGSLPGYDIASAALAIEPRDISADELERRLRLGETAVFARIYRDQVLLDLRTIQPNEEALVRDALCQALIGR
ncbi:MAG TPA: L-seryl-tRNA(Sec) selenium transferase [Firmicutes bacterium]|nr:L-seryl-tRNA(Sec) selenium transferase [Bacillota bacterium]